MQKFQFLQLRACQRVRLQRCSFRYRHRRLDDGPVREHLKHLAQKHPRWGYRFLCILLRREGHCINQKWSMDFVSDTLSCGRRFRALSVIDCQSRECLALEVDTSLSCERVVRVLEQLRETWGCPKPSSLIMVLSSQVTTFGLLGLQNQNAHIESFNGKLRNECLNLECFTRLREAQYILEKWHIQ